MSVNVRIAEMSGKQVGKRIREGLIDAVSSVGELLEAVRENPAALVSERAASVSVDPRAAILNFGAIVAGVTFLWFTVILDEDEEFNGIDLVGIGYSSTTIYGVIQ